MKIFQKGFNYSQDGDGNRLVFHLQGCNMKCPWCANPEGMSSNGVLVCDPDWILDSICPQGAISGTYVNRSVCDDCSHRACITEHKTKGMYLSFEDIPVSQITELILSSRMMFYDGGGVTFTGGEATLQFQELCQCLSMLRSHGIHTAIETNATHHSLQSILPLIDLLITDCKSCIPENHLGFTGIPLDIVKSNIIQAAAVHPCMHVRIPLIGGVNDTEDDLDAFISFFREIDGDNITYEVLRYHEYGRKKWEQCGMNYTMGPEAHISDDTYLRFVRAIKDAGLKYKKT